MLAKARIPLLAILAGAILLSAFSVFNYFGNSNNNAANNNNAGSGGEQQGASRPPPLQQQAAQPAEALHMPTHMIDVFDRSEKYYDTLDGGYLFVHDNIVDTRRHCEFCTSVDYQPGLSTGELDLTWASDKNFDISAAKKVTFYVMGDDGGEKIKFKAAGKKLDKIPKGKPEDVAFDIVTQPVTLDKKWQKFEIDLTKANLTGVSNPFGIAVEKGDNHGPIRVFVKAITLDDGQPQQPLPDDPEGEQKEKQKHEKGA